MKDIFYVSTSLDETINKVHNAVVEESYSGELIDSYTIETPNGRCALMVFEKNFMRSGRATLTVLVDDTSGRTRVHLAGSGGGIGLFNLNVGTADQFEHDVYKALQPYITED